MLADVVIDESEFFESVPLETCVELCFSESVPVEPEACDCFLVDAGVRKMLATSGGGS